MTNTKRKRLSLTFYHRGITVGVAPHPHGNPVRRDPAFAVLPWMWSPLPRFPRGYRGIPAVPITVQIFNLDRLLWCVWGPSCYWVWDAKRRNSVMGSHKQ